MVDAAIGIDGLRAAAHGAGLAAVAVLLALEAKPAEGAGHGQRAPSGQMYLQYGPLDEDRHAQDGGHEQAVGHARFITPTRKVVLNGSTSASFSARPMENIDTTKQAEEDGVLEPLAGAVVPALRQLESGSAQAHRPRDLVDGDSCSEPNGHIQPQNRPRPKQEHGDDDEDPEQEDERDRTGTGPGPLEQERSGTRSAPA